MTANFLLTTARLEREGWEMLQIGGQEDNGLGNCLSRMVTAEHGLIFDCPVGGHCNRLLCCECPFMRRAGMGSGGGSNAS